MKNIPRTEFISAKCEECGEVTEHTLHNWHDKKVYQCQECGKAFSVKKR
jgi:uncharacterized Zn finger protein